jgi:UDP-apiose/xylose synthase
VLACFMTALLDGKPMQLVDGGTARRTITSIYEAVDAVLRILERPAASQNQIFNIGNRNNEVTIAQLAELMRSIFAQLTGDARYRSHPIESVPSVLFYGEGYEDCDRRMPNLDRARRLLDWEPRASLEEILRETMRHYLELYGPQRGAQRPLAERSRRSASVRGSTTAAAH